MICTSVNDAVLHGIPDGYRLGDGDLLGVDFGAVLEGSGGNAAAWLLISQPRRADQKLIAAGRGRPGSGDRRGHPRRPDRRHLGRHRAGRRAEGLHSTSTPTSAGTAFGHAMHESPSVPNEGRARRGVKLQPGLVIAMEPWFLAGGRDEYRVDRDGWTLRSGDSYSAARTSSTRSRSPPTGRAS